MPTPEEGFDHSMDGIRYAITSVIKPEKKSTTVTRTKHMTSYNRTAQKKNVEEVLEQVSMKKSTTLFRRMNVRKTAW